MKEWKEFLDATGSKGTSQRESRVSRRPMSTSPKERIHNRQRKEKEEVKDPKYYSDESKVTSLQESPEERSPQQRRGRSLRRPRSEARSGNKMRYSERYDHDTDMSWRRSQGLLNFGSKQFKGKGHHYSGHHCSSLCKHGSVLYLH